MKHLNLTILAFFLSFASFAQIAAISGPTDICPGLTGTYTDATPGGTWSTSGPGILTISSTGIATGITTGVANVSYTIGGSYVTYPVTVDVAPSPITGPSTVCAGQAVVESDGTPGGTWSVSSVLVATIDPATGMVTGHSAGTDNLTYTEMTGCATSRTITVNPTPAAITGTPLVCLGGTITLSDAMIGGMWTSSVPAVIGLGSITGTVTGLSLGTADVTYTLGTGCFSTTTATVTASTATVYALTGGGSYCAGGTGVPLGLAGSDIGVTYQLFYGGVAVGSSLTGTGAPLSFGIMTMAGIYSVSATTGGGCITGMSGTATVSINALPVVFTVAGGGAYCSGGTGVDIYLSSSVTGISYQLYVSGAPFGASISGTGVSVDFGMETTAGTYTVVATDDVTGCMDNMTGSATVAVNPLPVAYTVTGGGSYCSGGSGVAVGLDNSDAGINYQLYNGIAPAGAVIAGTGLALDFGLETAVGSYTAVAIDPVTTCTKNMTGTVAVTITPALTVTASATAASCGGTVTLSAGGAATYSWSPSTGLSCSTCSSATLVPATSATYTVTGSDGGCTGTATVSVDGNRISGYITYTGSSTDSFRVWLIQFNSSDSSISAQDSMYSCMDGGIPYYEFNDEPAGNYMVKAMLMGTVSGTSGYIPTYSLSTPHWDSAATITHAASADSLHINMVYGTVPSGPGFISGYVVSGAGRNTSVTIPAAGMLIYLKNVAGDIITYTYTAPDGSYSFGSLANGSYVIYPETFKYYTTPSSIITLTPVSESATSVNFKQNTSDGQITPYNTTQVQPVTTGSGITTYPNPTNSNLNIQWYNQATGTANAVVTDVTGREVMNTALNMNTASGQVQIDLSSLNNGVYIITLKSASIYYTGKVVKQQ